MALYERYDTAGVKVARAFTVDGSEDDVRHAALAVAGAGGWQLVDEDGDGAEPPPPATPAPPPPADLPVEPGKRPAQAANKDAWVDWAVSHGMDREAADDLTKNQLIELADQLAKE